MFPKKQIFKLSILKKLLSDENGCVSLVPSTRLLALPPFFLNDMKSGILYLLNCMLKKYDRSLGGIVIGYQNIKVLMDENTGIIPMGTPETEVNISVEFYIFQPKIGSLLEGIINKKSSNHIGCLVHQYFNATILKPEDVDFDDWICKDFNVDEKIIFKVKDLDFTSLLPYIEGVVEENFLHKSSHKSSDRSDVLCKEKLLSRIGTEDSEVSEKTMTKNSNETEVKAINVSSSRFPGQNNFQKEFKKKNEKQKDQLSSKRELTPCNNESGSKADKSFGEKKKKKKKEKEKRNDALDSFNSTDHGTKTSDKDLNFGKDCFSIGNHVQLENENSNDFMAPIKLKREKKKKKATKENESLNDTLECSFSKGEDSVLYSTQLEPKSKSKMMVSFCSPIPRGGVSSVDGKWVSDWSVTQDSQDSEEKKAREDTWDKSPSLKKSNKVQPIESGEGCRNATKKLNVKEKGGGKKSRTSENKKKVSKEGIDDSLYKKVLKGSKNATDLETFKPLSFHLTQKPEKMSSKKDSELSDFSTDSPKKRHSPKKSKSKEKMKDRHREEETYKNGSMYDMPSSPDKTPVKWPPDKSLFSDSEQSQTSPAKKRKQVNGDEVSSEKKPKVQNKKIKLFNEESTSVKSQSNKEISKDSGKNEKDAKKSKRKLQSPDKGKESLYEKLLEQAKRLIDMRGEWSTEKKGKSGSGSKKQSTA